MSEGTADEAGATHRHGRNETEKERVDRELLELLQGFRVAVTGVQVLFAFLLTVPFAAGFGKVSTGGRDLFYVALFSSAVASISFIAPVIQHRILFRSDNKEMLIHRANRYGIWGALALSVSITASAALIMETMVSSTAATVAAALTGAFAGWTWFAQPLLSRGGWNRP